MEKRLRIAVNTRLLIPGKIEGLGRFTAETLRCITHDHPEHDFIFIFDRKPAAEFIFSDNVIPVVAHPQARHPILWYLFFEFGIPRILRKYKADLFLSPDGWLSLRTDVPSLAVIHDLNFFHNPQWIGKVALGYYKLFFPKFIRKATRIATVSGYSKNDIASMFAVDPKLIDVVHNGVNEDVSALSPEEKLTVREQFSGGSRYFLFLGLVHPRKNLTRIIKAFDEFKNAVRSGTKLLVAGSTKYWTNDTRSAWENSPYKSDIVFLGRLPDADTYRILGACEALVYASLFEGFGIPILEAFRAGVPVITSNVSSMPEVGGEAVVYVDPESVNSIAGAMSTLHKNKALRLELVEKGLNQVKKFSWQRSADRLWESIQTTLNIDN